MFEVRSESPFDGEWEARDRVIRAAAGRISEFAGAGGGVRDRGWVVATFEEARAMKGRLEAVPLVAATIRES